MFGPGTHEDWYLSAPIKDCPGLEIGSVSVGDFRHFAARFGTSDEVGPIGTYFDSDKNKDVQSASKVRLLGVRAGNNLIATACFTLTQSLSGQSYSCKLDSVIVKPDLRKQGLASLLVAHGFLLLLDEEQAKITTIYAHSVHPATVKLLRRHAFSEPNLVGAPISSHPVSESNRKGLTTSLKSHEQTTMTRLKHKCVRCQSGRKGAAPWCIPPTR